MALSTNILELCSGYGGLGLGLGLADRTARTVCHVEREVTAAGILAARMEDGSLDPAPIWSDLKTFDGRAWRGVVDIVTAGYPCQPFSVAGKRRGEDDPRHLWPEVARIVREVEPEWVFLENVGGHLRLGFREVAGELRTMGYRVAAGLFTAEEIGAPHRRERLFALAYREGAGRSELAGGARRTTREEGKRGHQPTAFINSRGEAMADRESGGRGELRQPSGRRGLADGRCEALEDAARLTGERGRRRGRVSQTSDALADAERSERRPLAFAGSDRGEGRDRSGKAASGLRERGGDLADAEGARSQERGGTGGIKSAIAGFERGRCLLFPPGPGDFDAWRRVLAEWPEIEPAICRIPHGLTARVDRLRALGNGVVPGVAAHAWRTLRAHFDGVIAGENADAAAA